MKILVLGSSGYIGSNFANFLTRQNHHVLEFDIKLNKTHDLRNENNKVLESYLQRVDFVFFFAFDIGNSTYIKEKNMDFSFINSNTRLMINTFCSISKFYKPFVFISSQMAANVELTYGVLKKLGENMSKSIGGVNCRIWNVFGGLNSENTDHVMMDFKNSAKSGEIILLTNGDERRQFIEMEDLCQMLYKIMISFETYKNVDYIDLTSHFWIKIKDLAKIFAEYYEIDVRPSSVKAISDTDRSPNNHLINSKYTIEILTKKIQLWLKQH